MVFLQYFLDDAHFFRVEAVLKPVEHFYDLGFQYIPTGRNPPFTAPISVAMVVDVVFLYFTGYGASADLALHKLFE
ncbi:MAG: hypothetical protein A3I26_02960 [Candidatus Yanofskybacteria bacterium RIFCSPLOWO2_02_FULL_43_10]|nr:MAG: hypothetical protein A3C69_00375 [Candidatus Yanofskybacteria bacterium RIFCSPHIGHO2_02_FULL_43_12]OGN30888.1 MAG: hypothetical protein A3I26_02960 [Candidatus Yanofskybacteria bacterium RIFCSPLOWO2_02_FULL_43_10]